MIRRHTRPAPAALTEAVRRRGRIVLRAARPEDAAALRALAALADRPLPAAELLVAEVDGELLAAVSAEGAGVVADPFRATADVVELLRLRAGQLRAAA